MYRLLIIAVLISPCPQDLWAGSYANSDLPGRADVIMHPGGYDGTGGPIFLTVCMDPSVANAGAVRGFSGGVL